MRQVTVLTVVLACLVAFTAGTGYGSVFNDPTKVNVLRQYDGYSLTNQVPFADSFGGSASTLRDAPNDGSGWNDFASGMSTSSDWYRKTFALPTSADVGSYRLQFDAARLPAKLEIDGYNATEGWQNLITRTTGFGSDVTGTFTRTMNATQLRYTVYGPGGSNSVSMGEVQVFMATGQQVNIDGIQDPRPALRANAYNLLVNTGLITATHKSTTGGGWTAANGNPLNLVDGNYMWTYVNSNGAAGQEYVSYNLSVPTQMNDGNLGCYYGQDISSFSFWTSNLSAPDPSNNADWTLQYSGSTSSSTRYFALSSPGQWNHIRLTANMQAGSASELELYGFTTLPEPSTVTLLGLSGLVLVIRGRKNVVC